MADTRVIDLVAITAPTQGANLLHIIDTADTTMSPGGTDKKLTVANFVTYLNSNLSFITPSSVATFTNKTFDTGGAGNSLAINGTSITAVTGTGSVVLATSPTLVTPTLGVATATTINKVTITAPATSATITIANSKTLTVNNTLTFSGTDGKTLTINNSLTLAGTDATTMTFPSSSGTVATIAATQTLTNKRRTRRVSTVSQSATPTINSDNMDVASITGLAQAITSFTTNLSGTPNAGDLLEIQITDNGTAQAITWGASFESTTITLPTTTVISTMLRTLFEWNTVASKWDCIGVA